MLEVIRNNHGDIRAVCEFNRVNNRGQLDDNGRYIYIADVEINENLRGNGLLKKFIKLVSDRIPDFDYCYFKREKYKDRLRMYSKKRWLNMIKENNDDIS